MLKFLINFINLVFITYLRFKYDKNTQIKIYDLDNTLANTYPAITINGKIPFSQLAVFPKVLKMILNDYQKSNTIVLFFTVRPLKHWKATYSWINIKGINISFYQLFMCQCPMRKVYLINKLRKKWYNITLIDDMSYNHENGEVKFYSNAIDAVKAIGIEYIGYSELRKFQQEGN
jgi:hypothetical protein